MAEAIEKLSERDFQEKFFSTKKEWLEEVNPNHPGVVDVAKSVHKRFKEVELSGAFNNSEFLEKEMILLNNYYGPIYAL